MLEMGNPALLFRKMQSTGLSSLFLLPVSDSADPSGMLVSMVASVTRDVQGVE